MYIYHSKNILIQEKLKEKLKEGPFLMDPPKNYFRTPQYLMDSVYNLLKVNANIIDFLNCLCFFIIKKRPNS